MEVTSVLNPVLYGRLLGKFGTVKIRNAGQARIAIVRRDLEDNLTTHVQQWGEQYYVCCKFCKDDDFRLSISYQYGQPNASGQPQIHLAHCHSKNCLSIHRNRVALAAMLNAQDGILKLARIRAGKVLSEEDRIPELPTPRTRLDELPKGHPARRWLKHQGFDPDKLARLYDLSFCQESEDPLTRHRIIIPVRMRAKHQGWQSLSTTHTDKYKYFSAPGLKTSELIYNFDQAREYETPVIVQEPTEVWAFGRMAMCPLGASPSDKQVQILIAALRRKCVILLQRQPEKKLLAGPPFSAKLESRWDGNLVVIHYPPDIPPGATGRNVLRELVANTAKKRGFSVSFRKSP